MLLTQKHVLLQRTNSALPPPPRGAGAIQFDNLCYRVQLTFVRSPYLLEISPPVGYIISLDR